MSVEVVKEIRLAVVMYGGVSLAIYINGVAQELLRMVRATAVDEETSEFQFDEETGELDATETSYRHLAYLLGDGDLMAKFAGWVKDKKSWETIQKELKTEVKKSSSPKIVRFVVDIMSGSSAGGINAIYLSKALVGGQNINQLQDLWVNEGDFSALLNDSESITGTELKLSKDPPSLFNSQRMYLKLLEAFETMDDAKNPVKSSMIDEVDLFVTLTDFWGLPVPVRLFDKIIFERNHRRRLHFKYRRDGINDFQKENYPFLAYAARCTFSFPVAFDPMKLSDTNTVLKWMGADRKLPDTWKSYFPEEKIHQEGVSIDWENRVFVDGGTLDNKPFGYAIEALAQRQANVLIDRKLIYIEPKPDLDGGNQRINWTHRPDAFKNTFNIVTSLPGYETIREDLQQVLERNRLIVRVGYIVSNARKDEYRLLDLVRNDLRKIISENLVLAAPRANKSWAQMTLAEIARAQGQAVYAYYRLRMAALTDDLARLTTRRAGFDETSSYFLAIRSLVRAWRLKNYNRDEDEQSAHTIPTFLYDFDVNYRLRRLRFVLQEADRLLSAIDKLKVESFAELSSEDFQTNKFANDLRLRCEITEKLKRDENFQIAIESHGASEILRQKFPLIEDELFDPAAKSPDVMIFGADKDELHLILRGFKKKLNQYLTDLDRHQQIIEGQSLNIKSNEQMDELNRKFHALAEKLKVEDLIKLLGEAKDRATLGDYNIEIGNKQGKEFLSENPEIEKVIEKITESLRLIYNGGDKIKEDESLFGKVRCESENLFSQRNAGTKSLENAVRGYLQHFYENFDSYDQIIFPITFETPIGEGDMVEVARISPADAVNLIDEEKDKKKKLAGDTFFSFSAFFNENWRKNDIMWGRLDAAERLVELVTSGSDLTAAPGFKETVVTEIQRQILKQNKCLLLGEKSSDDIDYVNFIKEKYKVNRILEENAIMKTTARALAVTARVLQSPTESLTHTNIKANKWLVRTAGLVNSSERMIEISSYGFSFKEFLSFLVAPFRMGWLTVFFLILLVLLSGVWMIVFEFLRISGVLQFLGISSQIYFWISGIIFVFGLFYAILLSLMYGLKNYIFRQLAKEIIGE